MKELFLRAIDDAKYQLDRGTYVGFLVSTIRSVLQHCAYAAVDYCYARGRATVTLLPEVATHLLQPNDGTLPPSIDRLLDIIRSDGWSSCCQAWTKWQPPAGLAGPLTTNSLRQAARTFVEFRNVSVHSVFDQEGVDDALEWLPDFARALVDGMSDLVPQRVAGGDQLVVKHPEGEIALRSTRLAGESPVVVERIQRLGTSWRAEYATLVARGAVHGFFELPDGAPLIRSLSDKPDLYRQVHVPLGDTDWRPTVRLPQRQTRVFEGRTEQLLQLGAWFEDVESRACQVYGGGGVGKTTLVLEFLHRLIEDPRLSAWRPDVICFFSAKQTRWGPGGLERLEGILPTLDDAARLLARLFVDILDRSWFNKRETRALLSRLEQMFAESGLKRDRVLLVLDNTETLAMSHGEEPELVREVTYISSRIARVIITSRRREDFEARSLRVEGMRDEEGEALLRRLALEYRAEPLKMAGSATLRGISQQLRGSPLMLDALTRVIARESVSIDRGVQHILAKAADDLGTFLYQDAWDRIEEEARQVFLTIAQLDSTVDGEVVVWACGEANIKVEWFLDAFEETRFGAIHEYGTRYDLVLNPGMREFLAHAYSKLDATKKRKIDQVASGLHRRRRVVIEAGVAEAGDRAAKAYTSTPARTAKLAVARGDFEDAHHWYERAVLAEPDNAVLWERYAWFLLRNLGDRERAWECAQRACAIDETDADAHLTAGLIAAERKDVGNADRFLDRASALGKPAHTCALQKANARLQFLSDASRAIPKENLTRLLNEANKLLGQAAIPKLTAKSSNDKRHVDSRESSVEKLAFLKQKLLRTRRTTARRDR